MPWYEFEHKRPVVHENAFVHPMAVLIGHVVIDDNCYIGAGAVLRGDVGSVFVGKGSNVQEQCVLHTYQGKEVRLSPNTHIGHGSILHGCDIRSEVLVGMGSTIMDDVVINERCLIGSNSLVLTGQIIPSDSVVMGSPAKVVKSLTSELLKTIRSGRADYQDLARRYLMSFREIEVVRRSQ